MAARVWHVIAVRIKALLVTQLAYHVPLTLLALTVHLLALQGIIFQADQPVLLAQWAVIKAQLEMRQAASTVLITPHAL